MPAKKELCVDSTVVPQFDSLQRIIEAVSVLSRGPLTHETIDLSTRHVSYVKHAARVLGLISEVGEVTAVGERAIATKGRRQKLLLRKQFEASFCGSRWLVWAKAASIDELDPRSASRFLEACSTMPPGMVKRRSRSLQRWCTDLRSEQSQGKAETLRIKRATRILGGQREGQS